jgi:CHAT domain-containing protein
VWWVGSDLLSLFPIHAAGYHDSGSQQNVMDRVISSYTPTIKALAYARERSTALSNLLSHKVMLVAMSTTPAHTDLPFVEMEVEELRKVFPSSIQIMTMLNSTKETVISALPNHQIVHMSCHGYSSSENPSQSMLLLEDWKVSPLTVSDLISMNIQLPQFAFLSTCDTANSKDIYVLDESINLVSAIQLADCPSVVGTLWYVKDIHCPEVAKSVYSWMLIGDKLDTRKDCIGLCVPLETEHVVNLDTKGRFRAIHWFGHHTDIGESNGDYPQAS